MFAKIHHIVSKGEFSGCEVTTKFNGQSYFAALTFQQPLTNDTSVFDDKADSEAAQRIVSLRSALAQPIVVKVATPDDIEQAVIDALDALEDALIDGHSQLATMDIAETIKAATSTVKASEKKAPEKKNDSKAKAKNATAAPRTTETTPPSSASDDVSNTATSDSANGDLFDDFDTL